MMHLMSCCSLLLLTASTVFADFTGQVVLVLDGDTIEVLHNQHPERIRLNGIDCPEKGQAYGKRAKHAALVARGRQTRRSTTRIADTGPRVYAQRAGLDRSFHRTGLIMVPNASRPIIIRKQTRDTKRKNAPRISASMLAHLLLFHRPFCFNCSDGVAVRLRELL
jgi:hypothetical protein